MTKIEDGSLVPPHSKMGPPPMRGDWKMVVDQLAWRLHIEDLQGAAKLLFTFLVDNADALDSNLDMVS